MARARKVDVPDVPEEHADQPDGWKRAYAHAMSMRYNSEKACVLFADAHGFDERFTSAATDNSEEG